MKLTVTKIGTIRMAGALAALAVLSACPSPVSPPTGPSASPDPSATAGTPGASPSVAATNAPAAGASASTPASGGGSASADVQPTTAPAGGASVAPSAAVSAGPSAGTTATPTPKPGTQASVPFSAALSEYLVLSGQGISNAGATAIAGDVGVSPAALSTVTGFSSVTFSNSGKVRSTAEAAAAQNDLTAAYNDAAGRAEAPVILGSTVNGATLPPGLYRTSAAVVVGPKDLILDASSASNPATAVFVFQIHDALTTAQASKVVLTGGALAKNVYWQVGSSATLGESSQMKGNILALTAITIGKNASLQGRAMARNASVTLDTNVITKP